MSCRCQAQRLRPKACRTATALATRRSLIAHIASLASTVSCAVLCTHVIQRPTDGKAEVFTWRHAGIAVRRAALKRRCQAIDVLRRAVGWAGTIGEPLQ